MHVKVYMNVAHVLQPAVIRGCMAAPVCVVVVARPSQQSSGSSVPAFGLEASLSTSLSAGGQLELAIPYWLSL